MIHLCQFVNPATPSHLPRKRVGQCQLGVCEADPASCHRSLGGLQPICPHLSKEPLSLTEGGMGWWILIAIAMWGHFTVLPFCRYCVCIVINPWWPKIENMIAILFVRLWFSQQLRSVPTPPTLYSAIARIARRSMQHPCRVLATPTENLGRQFMYTSCHHVFHEDDFGARSHLKPAIRDRS